MEVKILGINNEQFCESNLRSLFKLKPTDEARRKKEQDCKGASGRMIHLYTISECEPID